MSEFKVGDKVEHKIFKTWLVILKIFDDGSFIGRTRDLEEHALGLWEVDVCK